MTFGALENDVEVGVLVVVAEFSCSGEPKIGNSERKSARKEQPVPFEHHSSFSLPGLGSG